MPQELKDTALKVYEAIFGGQVTVEVDGVTYEIEKSSKNKLRTVDIEGLAFIEQNPHKDSRWAQLARDGSQIMWVMKGRQYIARVMDGKFLNLRKSREASA